MARFKASMGLNVYTLKGFIVFNSHQFRRLATLGAWGIFLLTPTVFAQMKTMPEFMPPEASHQAVVKLTQERVDVLQKKLSLQSDQVAAWSVWSTALLMDVKQQRMEDLKAFENSREHAMDNSSTPQKIRYQEKRLQFHIERLQLYSNASKRPGSTRRPFINCCPRINKQFLICFGTTKSCVSTV